jgi:hypothetical protein
MHPTRADSWQTFPGHSPAAELWVYPPKVALLGRALVFCLGYPCKIPTHWAYLSLTSSFYYNIRKQLQSAMDSGEPPGGASYDVFLSYSSTDHAVVEGIARQLRDEGIEPFLDRWYLAPGLRWRSKLEDTLNSCKAVAIFVGPGEMGPWQQREADVALDLQSRRPNFPVIPVESPRYMEAGSHAICHSLWSEIFCRGGLKTCSQ